MMFGVQRLSGVEWFGINTAVRYDGFHVVEMHGMVRKRPLHFPVAC